MVSAERSLPKQEPPQPRPARRKRGEIRSSMPSASATTSMSAPTRSLICAISLMKLILAARKEFAAYLIVSAVASEVAISPGVAASPPVGSPMGNCWSMMGR